MTAQAKQGYPVSSGVTQATEAMERIMGGYSPGAKQRDTPAVLQDEKAGVRGGELVVPLPRATSAPSKADRVQRDMRAMYAANWVHGDPSSRTKAHVIKTREHLEKSPDADQKSPANARKHATGSSSSDAIAAANAAAIAKLESEVAHLKAAIHAGVRESASEQGPANRASAAAQPGASAHEKLAIRHAASASRAQQVPIKITANKLSSSESTAATTPTLHAATPQMTEVIKEHESSGRRTHLTRMSAKQHANSRAHVSETPRASPDASPLFAAFASTAQHAASAARRQAEDRRVTEGDVRKFALQARGAAGIYLPVLADEGKEGEVVKGHNKTEEEAAAAAAARAKAKAKAKADSDAEKVAYGIEIASQEEQEDEILRCHIADGVWPAISAAPNVSVGFFLLNLEAEEKGLASGLFYADFLLFLRQQDRPLMYFEGKDPMKQLTFSNTKGADTIQALHTRICNGKYSTQIVIRNLKHVSDF
jgi:hypothetical protein